MKHWYSTLVACCIVWLAGFAHAQIPGDAPLSRSLGTPASPTSPMERGLVWQWEGSDLYARIRGHTNDMSLELFSEQGTPIPEDANAQWQVARALAQRYLAAMVIWFDAEALRQGRVLLRIALPFAQRQIERDLGNAGWDGERPVVPSVALEVAAVIARESAQATLAAEPGSSADQPLGDSTKATRHAAVSAQATHWVQMRLTGSVKMRSPPPPFAPKPRESRRNWIVGLGPTFVANGLGRLHLATGLLGRVARSSGPLEIGATAGADLPTNIESPYGRLRLMFGQATITGGVILSERRLQTVLGLQAGLSVYHRANSRLAPEVENRGEAFHLLGVLGPELRLRFPWPALSMCSELGLGLQIPTSVLDIGFRVDGKFQSAAKAWPVQPFVQFGIAVAP